LSQPAWIGSEVGIALTCTTQPHFGLQPFPLDLRGVRGIGLVAELGSRNWNGQPQRCSCSGAARLAGWCLYHEAARRRAAEAEESGVGNGLRILQDRLKFLM